MGWTALAAKVLDYIYAFQDVNELQDNVIALASLKIVHELGGSTEHGVRASSFADGTLPERRRPKINGANQTGFTTKVEGEFRTSNTGTSVSWQVVDLDNSSTVVASGGPYNSDTAWQPISATITLDNAEHRYELQVKGSNTNYDVFAYGRIVIYATA